ncbi:MULTISPECIES: PKD domain-containing protein [Streptomyces]|uniref:PKD domain-containing protein n=1 Tax=Streptomyces viridochromogenes TaxID=1938 RepID=A0A0L8J2W5_STRVR|nr:MULTISPECIES: PKD domain-containing protein [Streptomyces]KOG08102.1 hypothetical protein ADK34_39545 [Streptomyces viridochromogenes]
MYRSALSGFSAELTPAAVAALRDNPNAAPHVAGAAAWLTRGTNKPKDRAEVLAVRDKLVNAGNANWTDNSGDGAKEPLLDLHDPTLFPAGGTGGPDATFTGVCDNTGKTCTLDAGLSTGSGLTYRWDFGDGTTGTGVKPIHTYPPTTCTAS